MAKKVEGKNHYNKVAPIKVKKVKDETGEEKIVKTQTKTQNNNDKAMTKFVFKTAGITLACIVVAFFYLMSVLMIFAPVVPAKFFSVIGAKKAVTICYEQQYRRTPNIYTMYDVVTASASSNDNDRIIAYVKVLRNMKNYQEFEEKINTESRAKASKDRIALVYDVDTYINSLYIQGVYSKNDILTIRTEYIGLDENRKESHPYTITIIPYINALYADTSKTDSEKANELNTYWINGVYMTDEDGNKNSMLDLLNLRIDAIEDLYSSEDENGKIFNVYMQIKANECFYKVYKMLGNDYSSDQASYENKINSLKQLYNSLVYSN